MAFTAASENILGRNMQQSVNKCLAGSEVNWGQTVDEILRPSKRNDIKQWLFILKVQYQLEDSHSWNLEQMIWFPAEVTDRSPPANDSGCHADQLRNSTPSLQWSKLRKQSWSCPALNPWTSVVRHSWWQAASQCAAHCCRQMADMSGCFAFCPTASGRPPRLSVVIAL